MNSQMDIQMGGDGMPGRMELNGKTYPRVSKYTPDEMTKLDRQRIYRIDLAYNCVINVDAEHFYQMVKGFADVLDQEELAGFLKIGEDNG
jgi:hypothetical protein